jgi:enamine deaminase RidA (YjgF/YER057c/UK114 family)
MSIESRLKELGIKLMEGLAPVGNFTYIPAKRAGSLIFISGQVPRLELNGKVELLQGKVGATVDLAGAQKAARLCGISILSVLKDSIGNLDKVVSVVKVDGFVNATENYVDHPLVINGCSDLLVEVFGPVIGSHARAAVGCSSLPRGVPVEVSAIFEVRD